MAQSYAGDIPPEEAERVLREEPRAVLVDVRTPGEWRQVGVPDLGALGKEVVLLSWILAPGQANPAFLATLQEQVADQDAPLLFLCKSGARSRAAAMAATAAGYKHCYSVAEGFEGMGPGTGWKGKGLPWSAG